MQTMQQSDAAPFDDGIDDATVARVERNIDGLHDFLRSVIAAPSLLERVPKGATIIMAYDDDPALSAAHRRAAAKLEREGKAVYLHRVKSQPPPAEAEPAAP